MTRVLAPMHMLAAVVALLVLHGPAPAASEEAPAVEAAAGEAAQVVPRTRWEHRKGHAGWNNGALQALRAHGKALVQMVPEDIAFWCPGYRAQDDKRRRHFWVGFLSTLARYESTFRANAVGGGNRWFGLLQIWPPTARNHECRARDGDALKNGADNLSCAIRIMAETVARDGVIHGHSGRWLGVSADWGPLRSAAKRREMAAWLKEQRYCSEPQREQSQIDPARETAARK